ncbi:cytochrome c oxidase assembly protein [Mangrovibrevibacter kandeliae]|uniref:cytochrome c oxidase assembly protein n=1 Tax=Mangrovibrevibacter kandeliae TaxID=2968473 RepID=UPI0021194556|nr:cytochrome c oxidase assembly protein [Aurantimonas sp. CSK15Z-1]MCQ8780729.1 cytochrome c oxidase assembly protein [Aurantimonas sp. CSK15Z-1]
MTEDPTPRRTNAGGDRLGVVIATICAGLAVGMVGAAYAAVPLYQMFCQATGYGGTTQRVEHVSTRVSDRTVTVRFDSNAAPGVPWTFRPTEREVKVKLGETRQTAYWVKNLSDKRITARATYNVTPELAGSYFNKIACFCFTDQTLEPGEEKEMPIVFFVDPDMVKEPELTTAPPITLSYTFFTVASEDVAEAPAKDGAKAGSKL